MVVKTSYSYYSGSIPITVTIESNENEFVLIYNISIASISKTTEILLDKIRNEVITKVGVKIEDITDPKKSEFVQGKFKDAINYLLTRYLPGLADKTKDFLITYLIQKSLGLGKIELLLDDINLEEIVINNASEPVWVYHHKLGWLKTNIYLESEEQIKHYSALIGRKVGRSITLLTPLLDAHLETGERVNATLNPISTKGNTITLRKFNVKPITITNMLQENTISLDAASLIWAGIEFELSALVAGGTATGKCVTGDTKIILANGEFKKIKDIVENELQDVSFKASDGYYGIPKNLEILSMNEENKIVKSKVNYVWKKKSNKILKILTRDGREIKTTPEHPFFTLENCNIKEIRADKLEPGIKVACARRLPNLDYDNKLNIAIYLKNSEIAYVLTKEILTEEEINKIKKVRKFRNKNSISLYELNKIIEECKLNFNEIFNKINYVVTKTNHKNKIFLPKEISQELAEVLGCIIGDGHINEFGSLIAFTNLDNDLRERLNNNFFKVFGINGFYKKWKNKTPEVHIYSSVLSEILNKYFEIPRGKKERIVRVPNVLLKCHKNLTKYFLRTLFDCEAYVGDYSIEFSSASKEMVNQLKSLLIRYDIMSNINVKMVKGQEYYRLMIYSDEAEKFKEINFNLEYKKRGLEKIKGRNHKNIDILPNMSYFLKELFSSSNLTRKRISKLSDVSPRLLRWYSSGGRNPTINTLSRLSCSLENNCNEILLNKLNLVINSDIYWDEVILIQEMINDDEFVYDLTVDNHNFIIDNGLITHNTILLSAICSFFPPNQRIISIEDSVTKDCELLYKQNGIMKKNTIGNLIDSYIEKECIKLNDGTEIAKTKEIEIFSMNKNGNISLTKPSSLIRHKVMKKIFKVSLASGREIKVTEDHSLFSLKNNQISEAKCSNLRVGEFIATPRMLKYEGNKKTFNLTLYLDKFKDFMIKGKPIRELMLKYGKELVKNKSNRQHYRNKSILPASIFKELLTKIDDEDKKFLEIVPKRSSMNGRRSLPLTIKIEDDLATIIGMWLADGCYDKNSIIISDPNLKSWEVIKRFGSKFNINIKLHSDNVSAMINSKCLKVFFEEVLDLKGNAYTKKVPSWVFDIEHDSLSKILKGYLGGDGYVGRNEVNVHSCSPQLLKDIQTLLLRFEIPMRISWNMRKDKTYAARIAGAKFLKKFSEKINFIQDYKKKNLDLLCNKSPHDISDIIPLEKDSYLFLKNAMGRDFKDSLPYTSWKSWQGNYKRKSHIGREKLNSLIMLTNLDKPDLINLNKDKIKNIVNLVNNDLFWERIISIEEINYDGYVYDLSVPSNESFVCNNIIAHNTREINLPKYLHWIPMTTREPNVEGKGEIAMLDLIVNSLRMRPDRIVVGEIRRQREAETLFEAMHTGHSVYATLHANDTEETINRLVNPPINVPKSSLPAISMVIIMYRNRRTGIRRVFQVSEIEKDSSAKVIMQYDLRSDKISKINKSSRLIPELQLQTGLTEQEINNDLKEKSLILSWLVKNNIDSVDEIGKVVATYYRDKEKIMRMIRNG